MTLPKDLISRLRDEETTEILTEIEKENRISMKVPKYHRYMDGSINDIDSSCPYTHYFIPLNGLRESALTRGGFICESNDFVMPNINRVILARKRSTEKYKGLLQVCLNLYSIEEEKLIHNKFTKVSYLDVFGSYSVVQDYVNIFDIEKQKYGGTQFLFSPLLFEDTLVCSGGVLAPTLKYERSEVSGLTAILFHKEARKLHRSYLEQSES